MPDFFENNYKVKRSFFSDKKYFWLILIISVLVLISAYVLEYFFNYPPCKLCLYQRIPYFVLIFLAISSFLIDKFFILKCCCLICFFVSLLISGFHSLVERRLVDFDIGCTASNGEFKNIEDLRNFLEGVPITKCDEVAFSIFGFSLANLNLIISIILILLSIAMLKNYEKKI